MSKFQRSAVQHDATVNKVLCAYIFVKRVDLMLNALNHTHTHKATFGGDRYVYHLESGDGITGVWIYPDSLY